MQSNGTRSDFPKGTPRLEVAIKCRPSIIKAAKAEHLKMIKSVGLNPYKQVEMYKNYCKIVPRDYHGDVLCQKPTKNVIKTVKKERTVRKDARGKINVMKQEAQRKEIFDKLDSIREKVEEVAFGKIPRTDV